MQPLDNAVIGGVGFKYEGDWVVVYSLPLNRDEELHRLLSQWSPAYVRPM